MAPVTSKRKRTLPPLVCVLQCSCAPAARAGSRRRPARPRVQLRRLGVFDDADPACRAVSHWQDERLVEVQKQIGRLSGKPAELCKGLQHIVDVDGAWPYEKADLLHWAKVLDIMDAVLAKDDSQDDLLVAVLKFTRLLLENSSNRHVYNSFEVCLAHPNLKSATCAAARFLLARRRKGGGGAKVCQHACSVRGRERRARRTVSATADRTQCPGQHLKKVLEHDNSEVVLAVLHVLAVLATPRSTRQAVCEPPFIAKLTALSSIFSGAANGPLSLSACCKDTPAEVKTSPTPASQRPSRFWRSLRVGAVRAVRAQRAGRF
jgi:hypothetical protein